MKLAEASYTIFDVETTGLYPYTGDRICEVGAIRVGPKKRARKFHALVDPERPISAGAFAVNGITDEMVRGKPTIDKVLPGLIEFMEGSVLVAYNAGFDLGFLEAALGEKKDVLLKYHIIDALKLARKLFPGVGRYNLANVAASLGIEVEGEHRALSDAFMTWKVFEKELAVLRKEGCEELKDIERVQVRRAPVASRVKDYRLERIEEAIRTEKRLNIHYRSSWNGRLTKRAITPRALRRGFDRAYVIAHCHLRNEERTFRLDCIEKVEEEG